MDVDVSKVEEALKLVAEENILPYYKKLKSDQIMTKSSATDFVTIADQEAELALTAKLLDLHPETVVIGEESVQDDPSLLDNLTTSTRPVWVIDPVDGTYNFKNGTRHFCIMLACVVNGVTAYGWIYDMLSDQMMRAVKGEGAFLNDESLTLKEDHTSVAQAKGFAGRAHFLKKYHTHLDDLESRIAKLNYYGCAGHEYLNILKGNYDFSLYTSKKPWDHLAGSLAVEEAGGVVKLWNGEGYVPQSPYEGALLIARNHSLWDELNALYDMGEN